MNTSHPPTPGPDVPAVGLRFVLVRDVDRFPHFVARKGLSGTVVDVTDSGLIVGLLDQPVEGAREWGNQVWWENGFFDDTVAVGEECPLHRRVPEVGRR